MKPSTDHRTPEEVQEQLAAAIGRVIFLDFDTAPSMTLVARARFLDDAVASVLNILIEHEERP